jgi:hypothetical protein
VGVRLPCRHHDRHLVRGQAEQPAGELSGEALQRRRSGSFTEAHRQSRQLSGQRVGPARHARERVRVVPGLVSPAATRRRGPRLVCGGELSHEKRARRHLSRAPGRLLGRRGLALPLGLPTSIRARAAPRPHRLSGRRGRDWRIAFPSSTALPKCEPDFGVTSVDYDFGELLGRAGEPA